MACNSIVPVTRIRCAYLFDSWVAFTASLSQHLLLVQVSQDVHIDFFIIYA